MKDVTICISENKNILCFLKSNSLDEREKEEKESRMINASLARTVQAGVASIIRRGAHKIQFFTSPECDYI